ncbi:MAG TPA: YcfL family protein [Aquella sp.]|nr:YcfL family protein [Aquella sp.]
MENTIKNKVAKNFLAPLFLLGLLTGCATDLIKDHVEIIGDSLGDVEIRDLRSMRVNDLLVAQGTFFDTGKKPVQGYYRCKFLDTQDFQVGEDQTWQLLTIYPNQSQRFKCQSIHLEATNFKIEFSNNAKNVTVYH